MFRRWSPEFRADQVRSRKRLEDEGLHEKLEERFRKTLYYGELPDDDDCPSLPLTNLAVEFFQGATPRGLGQIDMSIASSLAQDAFVSPGSLVTSMIYAKRLRNRNPDYLQKMSSSDLFFISVMMASKYMYDEGVDEEVFNDEWAEAANLELDEVNQMEREFLSAMDWHLFVSQSEFLKSVHAFERRIAWTEGCNRNWLSYTDIDVLWQDQLLRRIWEHIVKEWLKVVTVSSAAYVAGVLTMVGSTALGLQLSTIAGAMIISQPIITQPLSSQPISTDNNLVQPMNAIHSFEDLPALPWNESLQVDTETRTNFSKPEIKISTQNSSPTLLEKVLPQLWAVVAFKDRLLHFMCAFSEGLKHCSEQNQRKIPKKCTSCPSRSEHVSNQDDRTKMSSERSGLKFEQCRLCPECRDIDKSSNLKSCPVNLLDHEPDHVNLDPLKFDLNFYSWCCHGNRPPDSINLGPLQYGTGLRGFTTSVPVAA